MHPQELVIGSVSSCQRVKQIPAAPGALFRRGLDDLEKDFVDRSSIRKLGFHFGAFLGPFQDPSGVPGGSVGALLGTLTTFGGPMATQGGAGSLEDAFSNYFWGFSLDCF